MLKMNLRRAQELIEPLKNGKANGISKAWQARLIEALEYVIENESRLPCGHDRKACFDEYEKVCIACKVEKDTASLSGYNAPVVKSN